MSAAIATFFVLLLIFAVRNNLIYSIRSRRIEWAHQRSLSLIGTGEDFLAPYRSLDTPSYDAMLFDVTKWSYAQFYPESKQ